MRLGTMVQSNSRIQFASNQSKLVPRKLDPGPSSKVGLSNPSPLPHGKASLLKSGPIHTLNPFKKGRCFISPDSRPI
jgi:hypothetical protein